MKKYVSALALFIVAGGAVAGFNYGSYDITVNPTGKLAVGGISLARRTPDSVQYIYCHSVKVNSGYSAGSCYARDKYYVSGYCSTDDPQMIAVIQSVNSSSYISFGWDDAGLCRFVTSSNGSLNI